VFKVGGDLGGAGAVLERVADLADDVSGLHIGVAQEVDVGGGQRVALFGEGLHGARGGEGCEDLARLVAETIAKQPSSEVKYGYDEADDVQEKVGKIAKEVYGADGVVFTKQALNMAHQIRQWGYDHFPVCVAKTQYSFSDDASRRGVPTDFSITIQDFVINAGAEMIVAIAGTIMRMPGLPKKPQAENIHVVNGVIEGLS